MNPRDVDILMGEIRTVLEGGDDTTPIGVLKLVLNIDGTPQTLHVPVSIGQLAALLRDMVDVVGGDPTP